MQLEIVLLGNKKCQARNPTLFRVIDRHFHKMMADIDLEMWFRNIPIVGI